MTGKPSTRRSFFGAAGGVALLCTIGGREVESPVPRACARPMPRPRRCSGRVPPPLRPCRRSSPRRRRPQGVLDPGRDRALVDHAQAQGRVAQPLVLGRNVFTAYVYRLMTPGFAEYAAPATSPDRRCPPRSATSSSCTSATRTRRWARPSRCTRTGSSTTPSTTAPSWASTRARAASSLPASRSPTSGSARPIQSATGRTTTTARTTRSTRSAACSARSSCGPVARSGPTASTRSSRTSCRRPSRAWTATSTASTVVPTPATRRR